VTHLIPPSITGRDPRSSAVPRGGALADTADALGTAVVDVERGHDATAIARQLLHVDAS
jgi:hypothetical protein